MITDSDDQWQEEDTVIRVQDASVTFDMDRGQSRVLDNVNLDIQRDEILSIVGESGSGKSMFASALLDAVVEPGVLTGDIEYSRSDGERIEVLELNDQELKKLRWEDISMVFQGAMSSFNPVRNIRKHFKETLEHHNHDLESGMEYAQELLTKLHLEPERILDSYAHELSGGMQQRALIALSLLLKPDVLVMDEPTAALDLLMQRSILSLLEELQDEYSFTMIFITHDLPLIADIADRVAVMYAFEFVEIGLTEEILESPTHPYTRALLNAVPTLDTPLSGMQKIAGTSPDPVNVPSGCSYHPRCPMADEQCANSDPHLYDIGEQHRAACHYWERSEDSIPISQEQTSTDTNGQTDTGAVTSGNQSEDSVLSLTDVSVHFGDTRGLLSIFGDSDTVKAVDNVDLEIYENDVVALVGESGCGKTTLGRSAIGVERPTGGTIEYRDQDIWQAKEGKDDADIPFSEIRRSLQMINQDPGSALNPNKTIKTSLMAPLKKRYSELSNHEQLSRLVAMLENVGMEPPTDYLQRYPHQLSGGEKQRVCLIRALLMNPDVILADEAVSALDVSLRIEMMDLMLELQEYFNTSYLFISHNFSNARYLAGKVDGRIGVMYLGEIVEIGSVEQIINDPQHPYTKVLLWATETLDSEQSAEEPPIRTIDIPDSKNPPQGCRFHTRCPEARDICTQETPKLRSKKGNGVDAACFRTYGKNHPYWDSELIGDDEKSVFE